MENFLIIFVLPFITVILLICIILLHISVDFTNKWKQKYHNARFDHEVDNSTNKKKLIDALQQKTLANDYAKSVEINNAKLLKGAERLNDTIKHLNAVNSIQSSGLKMLLSESEKLRKELDEKDTLLKECELHLKSLDNNEYTVSSTNTVNPMKRSDDYSERKKVDEINLPNFNELERQLIDGFKKQRISDIIDKLNYISDEIKKRKANEFVPNFEAGGVTSKGCEDYVKSKFKEEAKSGNPAKVKPYYYKLNEKCKKMLYILTDNNSVNIGSFCMFCRFSHSFGSNQKGKYIKCQTLNDSINEK